MEIERIAIENFQSHVNTVLEPAPAGQLTVIVGPSDSGKTAIIRALRWNYYDVPRGTDFINVKANAARVTVSGVDGAQVVRERSRKGYNRYVVDGQKYEGFGGEIPAEVLEVTGVRPVTIGDLKLNLNLAEQLDGPFLGKSVSAPARAKVLGKLAGTEEVDCAAKQLSTDLYRRRLDEKTLAAGIESIEKKIEGFDYLPAMARRIAELEKIVTGIRAARERGYKLAEARKELIRVKAGKAQAKTIIGRWAYVELAEHSLATAEKASMRSGVLSRYRERLADARDGIAVSTGVIRRWGGLEEAQDTLLKASDANSKRRRIVKLDEAYTTARDNVRCAQDVVGRWHGVEAAEEAYTAAVKASSRRAILNRRRAMLEQVRAAIGRSKKVVRQLAGLDEAGTMLNRAVAAGVRVARIAGLGRMLFQARDSKKEFDALLRRATQIEEVEKLTHSLEAAASRRGKILGLAGRLRQAKIETRRSREAAVLWEQKVSEFETAYRDELVLLGRCPLCGGNIDIQKLKEVV